MDTYIIFKSAIMLMALVAGFSFFTIRVRRLYQLMMAVEGKSSFTYDRIKERIGVFFQDVIGQRNVRRKRMPGLAHTLIFFGFLAVQPHSLELMVKGVCPAFEIGHLAPALYGGFLFVADILASFVLAGLAYALYRRLLVRPKYLTMGMDANLIIMFTSLIIITFHFINAFQTLLPQPEGFSYAGVFPVSGLLVSVFDLRSLSAAHILLGYEISYWVHMATIIGFLIYIPGSKHLHLLAAAPNVFLKPLARD